MKWAILIFAIAWFVLILEAYFCTEEIDNDKEI